MNNPSDIWNYLSQGVKKKTVATSGSSMYDQVQEAMLRPLINQASQFVMSWFLSNIVKYGEQGFHTKLSGTYVDMFDKQRYYGFDFVYDLMANHKQSLNWLMGIAAKGVNMVSYDINDMSQRLFNILRTKYGWSLMPHEKACISRALFRIDALLKTKAAESKKHFGNMF